jgi:phage pi2 protein 07
MGQQSGPKNRAVDSALAVNEVPAPKGGASKGGASTSESPTAKTTDVAAVPMDLDQVFSFATNKATRSKLTPTNFKERLAFLMPGFVQDSKNDAEWAFRGKRNDSFVRELLVVFANLPEKAGEKWVFSRIEVTVHPDDTSAAFKDLRQRATKMFKKPRWSQPNARNATSLGWKLDSEWELVTEVKDKDIGLTVYQPTED